MVVAFAVLPPEPVGEGGGDGRLPGAGDAHDDDAGGLGHARTVVTARVGHLPSGRPACTGRLTGGHARSVAGGAVEVRASLWRSRGMQALVGVTVLGFASYCLTLASLPVYAVGGGADGSTAGVVTAVFLVVTIAVQFAVPALTARFGLAAVLAAGLVAMGAPAPFYVLDDGVLWISALSAVRGAGFAVLTVLGATLAAQVAPPERRGESIGLYGLAIAVPRPDRRPGGCGARARRSRRLAGLAVGVPAARPPAGAPARPFPRAAARGRVDRHPPRRGCGRPWRRRWCCSW